MSIEWAKELEAQFFKDGSALAVQDKVFEAALGPAGGFTRPVTDHWKFFNRSFGHLAEALIALGRLHLASFTKVVVYCADVIRDRFLIIVEHNDKIFLQTTCVIDSFQGHTA